jgi:plastocyanin
VNSGADFEGADTPPYTLIFTKPGVYQPSCVLHFGMFGRVEVVARDATLTLPETPAQAQARGQQGFRGRATAFNNLIFAPPPTFPASILPVADAQTNVGTASVHNVVAGLGFGGLVTALQFLPADLTVRRGDTVIWSNSDPLDPGHTVTFTSGAPPPDFPAVRGTQPSGQPLFVLTADTMQPTGGSNYTGQGYVNSGFLAPGRAVALTIDAPAGTYAYQCLVHRDVMKGTITVVE